MSAGLARALKKCFDRKKRLNMLRLVISEIEHKNMPSYCTVDDYILDSKVLFIQQNNFEIANTARTYWTT